MEKLKNDIEMLNNNTCYACGQPFHDSNNIKVKEEKEKKLQEYALQYLSDQSQETEHLAILEQIGELGKKPVTFYKTVDEALNHWHTLNSLKKQLEEREKEDDPYVNQIEDMRTTALQEVNYERINDYNNLLEHQEFLLKLLTNKDSFIRKKIIDQNLSFLNNRLIHYLELIGLRHQVRFLNDLSVEITELGRDLDFHNLSRGEMTRVILGLSFAFRDVWESLYGSINLLFVDEMIDNGLDTNGAENAMHILKDMSRNRKKSIWLISHKDELIGRVNNTMMVYKENGFTTFGELE
jgi:energy-coupling factor transporter ATP-binding protein EcfA2